MTEQINRPDRMTLLDQVANRFYIDSDLFRSPLFPVYLDKIAKEECRRAVEANKKRGWHWRSDMPVEIDKSEIQVDLDLFASTYRFQPGVDQYRTLLEHNKIAMVIKLWYEIPATPTEVLSSDLVKEADGFVQEVDKTPGKIEDI